MTVTLATLRAAQIVASLDEHFALAVGRIAGETNPEVLLAAALASRAVRMGHVCLDLPHLMETPVTALADGEVSLTEGWPDGHAWMQALARSRLVGDPNGVSPLVLDGAGRLYLRRYWTYQARLAEAITARAAMDTAPLDAAWLRQVLARLFPEPPPGTVDWQRLAAVLAALRPFCVISGGPGTGKTYTVVKILALLIEAARHGGAPTPRITLVAPTGKAAARLAETIRRAKATLSCEDVVKQAIPEAAATIHRCLGWRGGSGTRFYHNAANPLLADIVLVDEASMVDLALMAHLVEAIPPQARVILLGDKDQLASVEAGAVLGDICNTGERRRYSAALAAAVAEVTGQPAPLGAALSAATGLGDCIVELQHSYRYGAASGIGRFAAAIKDGDGDGALELLAQRDLDDLAHEELSPEGKPGPRLSGEAVSGFRPYLSEPDPLARLRTFTRFRVLCAHRRGTGGVEEVNALVEAALRAAGLLEAEDRPHGDYVGRPLMVTTNDYHVNLFNGDVGIVGTDPQRLGGRVVFFDGEGGQLRSLAPARLPPHETAFAMSVHKSQGSEFDEVAVLLPQRPSPVVTRELLYTAVTRARRKVTIHGALDVVRHAITCPTRRASGLRDLLWGFRRS